MSLTLLAGKNSNLLIFSGLINGLSRFSGAAYPAVNDASGTAELLNQDETSTGGTPVSFSYIKSSQGDYFAQVPADWSLTAGVKYKIRVFLVGKAGEELDGIYPVTASDRTT